MELKGQAGALAKPHVYAWEKEYRTGRGRWRGTTNFMLELPAGSRVFEVGCGNGKHLSSLFNKGFEVIAVDVSPSAVKLAKRLAEDFKAEANIIVGDACSLDFGDGFFDAVFVFHVLGHLTEEERGKAVAEVYRVTKKGGKCFFRGFGLEDFRFGKGSKVEENTFRRGTNVWVHYFSEGEVMELFEGAGFKTESVATDKWTAEFHGRRYQRAEIQAEFARD